MQTYESFHSNGLFSGFEQLSTSRFTKRRQINGSFFEESELSHVSFLNKFSKDLPSKLAYLGFAYEAVIFQKMITNIQKISGALDPIDHERLSYYQMLSDDLLGAEESLFYVSKNFQLLRQIKIIYF